MFEREDVGDHGVAKVARQRDTCAGLYINCISKLFILTAYK